MDNAVRLEIIQFLQTWHRGPGRAIPRTEVLEHLRLCGHRLSDRTLRRTYTTIRQVYYSCGGPRRGLYWSEDERDARDLIEREHGRGIACLARGSRAAHALAERGQGILISGRGGP